MMPSDDPRVNLAILAAAIEQLPAYLRSGGVAMPVVVKVDGRMYRPSISIGFVLDLLRELDAAVDALGADGAARIEEIRRAYAAARAMDRTGFATHLARELKSQLDTWAYYLDDCARGREDCAADYAVEARARTRAAALVAEAERTGVDIADSRDRLADLDARLAELTVPGRGVSLAVPPSEVMTWAHSTHARRVLAPLSRGVHPALSLAGYPCGRCGPPPGGPAVRRVLAALRSC